MCLKKNLWHKHDLDNICTSVHLLWQPDVSNAALSPLLRNYPQLVLLTGTGFPNCLLVPYFRNFNLWTPIAPLQSSKPGSCPAVDHVKDLKLWHVTAEEKKKTSHHLVLILASQPSTISLSHGNRQSWSCHWSAQMLHQSLTYSFWAPLLHFMFHMS